MAMRFHTQTAGSMLTSQQSENNVVRVTLQALAAVLGGTQSLHTNGRDEALSLPTADSARLALRTQQILANESGVADIVDPLGGAPMIEQLTDELEVAATALMAEVDERGGAVEAISSGFVQREIHRSALAWQREVESGERVVVGVNEYQMDEEPPTINRPDPAQREQVLADLALVRAERDAAAVEGALTAVEQAARGEENIMPALVDAVGKYATIGELCGVLQGVFGEHHAGEGL
jgi:methylmalonyl-CoA mutase N-terminal domain/subunit